MVVCLDMEGVLVPEIWVRVAKKTGIRELRLTTRDVPNYDALMNRRLQILRGSKVPLAAIQKVIGSMAPLPGARRFLVSLRSRTQVIILSDTFYEFAMPLMRKLGNPTLFCNWLSTDPKGFIKAYHLRQPDGKTQAVKALQKIGFKVSAAGDSYNDIGMLKAADRGVLFNPPSKIVKEFPKFTVTRNYEALLKKLCHPRML